MKNLDSSGSMNGDPFMDQLPSKRRVQVFHSYDVASRLQVSYPSISKVVCVQYLVMQRPTLASSPADKMLLADSGNCRVHVFTQ